MSISTEKELANAIKKGDDIIEITGDLKDKTLKIKATGKVAWVIAIGAIGIAATVAITSGGVGAPVSGLVGIGAVSVLGLPAAISAVTIAVAAGGVGVLNTLRSYKIIENKNNKLVLKKR